MNKTFNLILMILMFALAIREGYSIVHSGANSGNVLFCLVFTAFGVRRLLIHSNLK